MKFIQSKGKKIVNYLAGISPILYLIVFFCLAGLIRNLLSLSYYGFSYATVAGRALFAMSIIYLAQILLILLRNRNAWVISAIQAFFCFYVYEDFSAIPFSNLFKMMFWAKVETLDYGWIYFINMVLISAMFSLELLKTYLIYALTSPLPKKKQNKKEKEEKSTAEAQSI